MARVYFRLLQRFGYDPLKVGLSEVQRAIVVTTSFEDESFADGIQWYLYNTYGIGGQLLRSVADRYRRIGVPPMAEVADAAAQVLSREPDPLAENVAHEHDALYVLLQQTESARAAFIRANADAFVG